MEFAERAAIDLAHCIPVGQVAVTTAKRRFDKRTIIAGIVHDGINDLHFVCDILTKDDSKEALERFQLWEPLKADYIVHSQRGETLRKQLEAVKKWDIKHKRELYSEISAWRDRVVAFKMYAIRKSDWAKLRLDPETASLEGEPVGDVEIRETTSLPHATPPSASVATLVAFEWPDDAPAADGAVIPDPDPLADTRSQYSATNSMHGNPWLNYEPEGLARSAAGAELTHDASRETGFALGRKLLALVMRSNARGRKEA
ncbi:hypothetical protein BD310DRAFT_394510 [Dichomitus squalens]|uniref:Uncharacterized protein n=1 Tax=Dichomitus squalens TaxID=114155 RepID=A0A4Q9QB82_9APHY|nr:hypothetical protein BD310DRAFT_394510 [Dichomitus squalens]